ncbi:MAG: GNAT family N-acetyltransferase [Lentisphaeria bacterium]
MRLEDQNRFPSQVVRLHDGREAVLRFLTEDDAAALGDFYAAVPPEDFRFYSPHPLTREKAAEIAAAAQEPFRVTLVLDLGDGRIGGYAWYRWAGETAERSGFGICLHPECQGLGAGRLLMDRLFAVARVVGPPVMGLTVQAANVRGVELYKKLGFKIVREQMRAAKPEYGLAAEPEYHMERPVR